MPTSVTTEHPKGVHFMGLVGAVYDGLEFSEEGAQRINRRGGEMQKRLEDVLRELSLSQDFADEEVSSNYVYPSEYTGSKSIVEQIEALLGVPAFADLDFSWALEHGQAWYDGLSLPDWVEGPLVYVWHEVMSGGYHQLLEMVLQEIADFRDFHNYRQGKLTSSHLRQHAKTMEMEKLIKANQPGDLIIVPNQAGLRHRGCSVRRAHVRFVEQEFGLGSVAEGCRALTHPERFQRWEQLHVDCAGDEYSPSADSEFGRSPFFGFLCGELVFGTGPVGVVDALFGSSSALLPQSS